MDEREFMIKIKKIVVFVGVIGYITLLTLYKVEVIQSDIVKWFLIITIAIVILYLCWLLTKSFFE